MVGEVSLQPGTALVAFTLLGSGASLSASALMGTRGELEAANSAAAHRVEEFGVALGGFDFVEQEFHRGEMPAVPRRPQAWGGNGRRARAS